MGLLRVVVLTAAIGCGDDGGFFVKPPDAPPAKGTFSLRWTVTDANGVDIGCDPVGAQAVTLSIRNISSVTGETAVFACGSGMGTTQQLPEGRYVVDFELIGQNGVVLSALPRQTDVIIAGDRDTSLGDLRFPVNAVGALDLHLSAAGTLTNCGPASSMGAGITGLTLTLQHLDGTCQPAMIEIAAGATRPASVYVVSCTSPQVATCIENDQRMIAQGLPSGRYTIRIRGKVGASDCWSNDDSLAVPALGASLVQTLNLTKSTAPGC